MKTYKRNNIEVVMSQPFDSILTYAHVAQLRNPSKKNEKIIKQLEKLNLES